MFNQDDFEEEVLTPEERLDALLTQIEEDMKDGRLSSACAILRTLGPLQLTLIETISVLQDKFERLRLECDTYEQESQFDI